MNKINTLTEMFAVDDQFYNEFSEYLDDILFDGVENIGDVEVENCTLKPVLMMDKGVLWEMIQNKFEENSSESGDEWDTIYSAFYGAFTESQFKKFNDAIPKLWWPSETVKITKEEILQYIDFHGIDTE